MLPSMRPIRWRSIARSTSASVGIRSTRPTKLCLSETRCSPTIVSYLFSRTIIRLTVHLYVHFNSYMTIKYCALLCSRASNTTFLLFERESQFSSGGAAAADVAEAVGERAALLQSRRESGAQLLSHTATGATSGGPESSQTRLTSKCSRLLLTVHLGPTSYPEWLQRPRGLNSAWPY